jgi:aspartate kinase
VFNINFYVVKVGGSVLNDGKDFLRLANELRDLYDDLGLVVVVSAMKGVTDSIISLLEGWTDVISELKEKHIESARYVGGARLAEIVTSLLDELMDSVRAYEETGDEILWNHSLSYGERISKLLMRSSLELVGFNAIGVEATSLIRVNEKGLVDYNSTIGLIRNTLVPLIKQGFVPVIEGFIGSDVYGDTYTLGRGGSDYTASIIAGALNAARLHLITNTSGILSAPEDIITKPMKIEYMDYIEANEACQFGIKRFHPKTFEPILKMASSTETLVGRTVEDSTKINWKSPENWRKRFKTIATHDDNDVNRVVIIGNGARDIRKVNSVLQRFVEAEIPIKKLSAGEGPSISLWVSDSYVNQSIEVLHELTKEDWSNYG